MNDRAYEIAQELLGTCQDVTEVVDSFEYENLQLMSELDDYAMRCETCGWWSEPDEMDTTGGECQCEECSGA